MSYYQYQICVNGSKSEIVDELPSERWTRIADASENRAITATLNRRIVSSQDTRALYPAFKVNDNLYISTWEVFAQIESR